MAATNKIPALRFPEFSGEWQSMCLGDLSKNVSYGLNSAAKEFDGVNKYLRITDIDEGTRLFKPNPLCSPEGTLDVKYQLKDGDITFTRTGASVGKSYIYKATDGKLYYAGFLIKFTITEANPFFVFLQTLTKRYDKWVLVMSMRSGQPGINAEEYKTFKFPLPELPEQEKIASFLTAVDSKVQQLTKKVELLQQYKKGAMQQLFSQQIRFKNDDGTPYPDWEEKRLGEVGKTFNGLTGKTKENFGTGKPYIQYKQIFDGSKIDIDKCDLVEISKNEKQEEVKFGDIFFTTSSETPKEIGTASVLLSEVDEMYLNSFCFGYRVAPHIINPWFAQFLFRSEHFRKKMIPLAQGSTRYNISKSSFLKLNVVLPNPEEQQKIASFLSAIDDKINQVQTQLQQAQQFKKGLLQQMFV